MTSEMDMEMDEISSAIQARLYLSSLPPPTPAPTTTATPPPVKPSPPVTQTKKTDTKKKEKGPAPQPSANKSESKTKSYDRWALLPNESIDYGYVSATEKPIDTTTTTTASSSSKDRYYITTAINYTNGPAHMGHAYEATTADCIARFHRLLLGSDISYFVTGSDEHGQKIANTAEGEGKKPIEICDKYVTGFQCLNQRILISNNDYIRTTSKRHITTAQKLWNMCATNNDIYLSKYSGWYNVREETFVTDSDAKISDYKDPTSGLPLKRVEEESYFFRMGNYHDQLVEYIENHPEFIQPEAHRNAILARLNADRLRDLSISRTTFDWGIPVPEGFDKKHYMYVWFDALSNYLTGVNALGVNDDDKLEKGAEKAKSGLANFWPADVHIIGKDILWFHTVIWPCVLFSAKIPLPKTVFAHGFVNDKEGKKMSKSMGNVVDPHDMLDLYSVDTFRWYLCKEAPYGGELSFSESSLTDMHNADLADTLGNLVHRATNLCGKYCGGVVPDVSSEKALQDFDGYRDEYITKMKGFELEGGAALAMKAFREVNGYLTDKAPWHIKGKDDASVKARQMIVRAVLESVYALGHFLMPFLPVGAKAIFNKLNTIPKSTLKEVDGNLMNLAVGTKIDIGDILYSKIISQDELNKESAAKMKAEAYADAQKRKKEKKKKEIAASKAGQSNNNNKDQPDFTKMDIRVGQITKVWHHPEADKLFCEEIDVGEENKREIASGLREHYTLEQMEGRKVLVVCNLKAAKIVGFVSNGMVLAAKSEDGKSVELIDPPSDSPVGERVFIEGLTGFDALSPAQVKKKKVWDLVSKKLKTGDEGVATWDGKEIKTSTGVCAALSLVGAPIS